MTGIRLLSTEPCHTFSHPLASKTNGFLPRACARGLVLLSDPVRVGAALVGVALDLENDALGLRRVVAHLDRGVVDRRAGRLVDPVDVATDNAGGSGGRSVRGKRRERESGSNHQHCGTHRTLLTAVTERNYSALSLAM